MLNRSDISLLGLLLVGGFLLDLAGHQPLLSYQGIALALLQCLEMRLDVLLELVRALVVNGLGLVVDLAVLEDPHDVLAEVLAISVLVVGQLLLDGLEVDRLLHH